MPGLFYYCHRDRPSRPRLAMDRSPRPLGTAPCYNGENANAGKTKNSKTDAAFKDRSG